MTTRTITEMAEEVERQATDLSIKMKLLQEYYMNGVKEIDDITWEPVLPADNVVPFPIRGRFE